MHSHLAIGLRALLAVARASPRSCSVHVSPCLRRAPLQGVLLYIGATDVLPQTLAGHHDDDASDELALDTLKPAAGSQAGGAVELAPAPVSGESDPVVAAKTGESDAAAKIGSQEVAVGVQQPDSPLPSTSAEQVDLESGLTGSGSDDASTAADGAETADVRGAEPEQLQQAVFQPAATPRPAEARVKPWDSLITTAWFGFGIALLGLTGVWHEHCEL